MPVTGSMQSPKKEHTWPRFPLALDNGQSLNKTEKQYLIVMPSQRNKAYPLLLFYCLHEYQAILVCFCLFLL